MRRLFAVPLLILALLTPFAAGAYALDSIVANSSAVLQTDPPDPGPVVDALNPENLAEFAQLVLDAVASKNYLLLASLGVIAVVYVLRRFAGGKFPWLRTDRGGALLVLLTSIAGGFANAFLAGSPLSWGLVLSAVTTGLAAAGGYSIIKKLVFGDAEKIKAQAASAGEQSAAAARPQSVLEFVNTKRSGK